MIYKKLEINDWGKRKNKFDHCIKSIENQVHLRNIFKKTKNHYLFTLYIQIPSFYNFP